MKIIYPTFNRRRINDICRLYSSARCSTNLLVRPLGAGQEDLGLRQHLANKILGLERQGVLVQQHLVQQQTTQEDFLEPRRTSLVACLAQALSVSLSHHLPAVDLGLVPPLAHPTVFLEAPTLELEGYFPSRIMLSVPTNQLLLALLVPAPVVGDCSGQLTQRLTLLEERQALCLGLQVSPLHHLAQQSNSTHRLEVIQW